MRVRILGSAAGGGFPQWNCHCPTCTAARAGDGARARTQSSLAIRGAEGPWFLANASPDLREQLEALGEGRTNGVRAAPVAGVLLTDAEIDHTAGLLLLRESSSPLRVYGSDGVRQALTDGYPVLPILAGRSHERRRVGPWQEIGENMAIGPVQLIVLGFPHPDFHGEIIAELERLRDSDSVRVIDALAVYKDDDGEIEAMHLSNLSLDEAVELGSKVGALIGLGFDGEEGAEAGAEAGAQAAADGIAPFPEDDAWDVLEDIPNGTAAALVLLEHHWAVGLRDAVAGAGGYRVSDAFISPLDLIALGMVTAEEAAALHEVEMTAVPTG